MPIVAQKYTNSLSIPLWKTLLVKVGVGVGNGVLMTISCHAWTLSMHHNKSIKRWKRYCQDMHLLHISYHMSGRVVIKNEILWLKGVALVWWSVHWLMPGMPVHISLSQKYISFPAFSVFFYLGRLVLQIELFKFVEGRSHFEKTWLDPFLKVDVICVLKYVL